MDIEINKLVGSSKFGLIFFGNEICPYCQRVELALIASNLSYEHEIVDFNKMPEWVKRVSPIGKVPILLTQQGCIFESDAIINYINNSQNQFLASQSVFFDALIISWVRVIDQIHNLVRRYFLTQDKNDFIALSKNIRDSLIDLSSGSGKQFWDLRQSIPIIYVYLKPLFFLINTLNNFIEQKIIQEPLDIEFSLPCSQGKIESLFDSSVQSSLLDFLCTFDSVFSNEVSLNIINDGRIEGE